ncbi:MAG: hypothetical protein EBZ78_10775 [Verrucomicrobia bacterium]|nr:hypothetical protein [Verrucomicrobiota bacterium]
MELARSMNPYARDSDGDGYFDGLEVYRGSDPTVSTNTPLSILPVGTNVVTWLSSSTSNVLYTNRPGELSNVVAVAAGSTNYLALRRDGRVIDWKTNSITNTAPAYATNMVAVAASSSHSVGLNADGVVWAWGTNSSVTTSPTDLTNVVDIGAGTSFTVALLSDGRIRTWGTASAVTNCPTNSLTNVVKISVGATGAGARRGDGSHIFWGNMSNLSASNFVGAYGFSVGSSYTLASVSNTPAYGVSTANSKTFTFLNIINAQAVAVGSTTYFYFIKTNGSVAGYFSNSLMTLPSQVTTNANVLAFGTKTTPTIALLGTVSNQVPYLNLGNTNLLGKVGDSYSLTLTASGTAPISFGATNLPPAESSAARRRPPGRIARSLRLPTATGWRPRQTTLSSRKETRRSPLALSAPNTWMRGASR